MKKFVERINSFFTFWLLRPTRHAVLVSSPTADFQHLVDGNAEIFRLLFHTVAKLRANFGGIDKIKPEDVFVSFDTDVETVAIVRSFGQVMTALQCDPRRMGKRICDARREKECGDEKRANERMFH